MAKNIKITKTKKQNDNIEEQTNQTSINEELVNEELVNEDL